MDKQIEKILAYIEEQKAAIEANNAGEDRSYIFGKMVAYYEIQGFLNSLIELEHT